MLLGEHEVGRSSLSWSETALLGQRGSTWREEPFFLPVKHVIRCKDEQGKRCGVWPEHKVQGAAGAGGWGEGSRNWFVT